MMNTDEFYMTIALEEAKKAFEKNEVPVGAVVVLNGKLIARAHNQVESLQDATAHAEMLALREAASQIGNWRLIDATLYCTLQPCHMCVGAVVLSRLKTVVWGAPDFRHGGDIDVLTAHPIHQVQVRQGVLLEESSLLMKTFFQRCRHGKIVR